MQTIRILGVSASLRNARFGAGSDAFIADIGGLSDRAALESYLAEQSRIILTEFFEQGRADKLPFDQMLRELRAARGDRGLSNSEAALGAALWGAQDADGDSQLRYCGLASHFPATGGIRDEDALREAVLWADAIILSGPVYFGDRGSLAQSFFEFIAVDDACRRHVADKVFAGVTVGAKRNGGQETTLIYQIVDAGNLGMLPVGNDASTTSQYGGTAVAGDVGTFGQDEYGINTCVGTGQRVARVTRMLHEGRERSLREPARIAVWVLQDDDEGHGASEIGRFLDEVKALEPGVAFDLFRFDREYVHRCIACDVCPIETGPPEEYRCIIRQRGDLFAEQHANLISYDAILVAAYSPKDRHGITSVYQKFIERTRYLRRDSYQFGDRLCAPLVLSEIGSNQNLHIRMLTSMVRHDTVLHHPVLLFQHAGGVLNREDALHHARAFCRNARTVTAGRLALGSEPETKRYQPVGYVVSMEKHHHDESGGSYAEADEQRRQAQATERDQRLA